MHRSIVAVPLLLAFAVTNTYAADLRSSVSAAAERGAALAAPRAASITESRYFIPSVALMGTGAAVALYGLLHETGAECSGTGSNMECHTTHSTPTIIAGAAIAGAGAVLLYKGAQ